MSQKVSQGFIFAVLVAFSVVTVITQSVFPSDCLLFGSSEWPKTLYFVVFKLDRSSSLHLCEPQAAHGLNTLKRL